MFIRDNSKMLQNPADDSDEEGALAVREGEVLFFERMRELAEQSPPTDMLDEEPSWVSEA